MLNANNRTTYREQMEAEVGLSAYEQKCLEMKGSAYSPENSLDAFQTFWDTRAQEIGRQAAQKEYTACDSEFKQYISDLQEHVRIARIMSGGLQTINMREA